MQRCDEAAEEVHALNPNVARVLMAMPKATSVVAVFCMVVLKQGAGQFSASGQHSGVGGVKKGEEF